MRVALLAVASALVASAALAQAPASAPAAKSTATATTTTATPKAAPKPRTAASLQCSKDADAKNIHGKPRKAFMNSCKKAAAKG